MDKTSGALLKKQGRTHKWHSSMDPIRGWANVARLARIYLHQLCADTWCTLEDLPGAMDDRERWGERERERERERQGNQYVQYDLTMMIIYQLNIWVVNE